MRFLKWNNRPSSRQLRRQQERKQAAKQSAVESQEDCDKAQAPGIVRKFLLGTVGAVLQVALFWLLSGLPVLYADDEDSIRIVGLAMAMAGLILGLILHNVKREWVKTLPFYFAFSALLWPFLISTNPDLHQIATFPNAAYSWAERKEVGCLTRCWHVTDSVHWMDGDAPILREKPIYTGGIPAGQLNKSFVLYTRPGLPLEPEVYLALPDEMLKLPLESNIPAPLQGGILKLRREIEYEGWYYDWPDEYPIGESDIIVVRYPYPG